MFFFVFLIDRMKKVYWNTEIFKKLGKSLPIPLFTPANIEVFSGIKLVLIRVFDGAINKDIEILEDADQIIAAGEYLLMSEIIMQVPSEFLEIYTNLKELSPDIPYGCIDYELNPEKLKW